MSPMMKVLTLLVLCSIALAEFDKQKLCKELSSDDLCENFRKAAEVLNLKGRETANFIEEASSKGLNGAKEVRKFIKDRLDTELSTKSCGDIIDKKLCQNIKGLIGELKATGNTVKESVKDVINKGASHVEKVYENAMDKINEAVEGSSYSFNGFLYDLVTSNGTRRSRMERDDLMSLKNVLLNVFDKTSSIFRTAIGKLVVLINERMLNLKRKVQLIIEQQMKEQKEKDEAHPSLDYSSLSGATKEFEDFGDGVEDLFEEISYGIRDLFDPDAVADRRQKNRVILETVVEHLTKAFREVAGKSGRIIKDIRNTMKKTGNKMIDISKIVFDNVVEIVEQLKRKGVFRKRARIMDRSRPIEVSGKLFPSRKGWEPTKSSGDSINWNPSGESNDRGGSSRGRYPDNSRKSRGNRNMDSSSNDRDRAFPGSGRERSRETEDVDNRPFITLG